jgi:DNA-binding NtrC family response regulator
MAEGQFKQVLVVDDEASIRDVLRKMLEGVGYQVTTAASGEEALNKISTIAAPIVLLDIRMPGISGLEALAKIVALNPDACVLMVTAVMDTETAVEAMKLGAYDYIMKPFERETVIAKLQKAVVKWSSQQQEKKRYLELREKFLEKTNLMQEQFNQLVESLAREHKLIIQLSGKSPQDSKALSILPPELRKPINSIEEFRDALLKILRRA